MFQVAAAFLVDLVVGDPNKITHPVVIIGKGIDLMEKHLRKWVAAEYGLKIAGIVLAGVIVGGAYLMMWAIVKAAMLINNWLGLVISIWFMSTTLAVKGLSNSAMEIFNLLNTGKIEEARKKTGWIVGRDTANLDEAEITRATVETVAENIVDGIIAPMFYGFIGGVPLAMAYKAVNTLDSMVGYKNDKYQEFGWASARFDDLCNYIPARITGAILLISFMILGKSAKQAYKAIIKDAPQHPSPNSGIPEAAVAGALGIRLGGINSYRGVESFRQYMGEARVTLEKRHIQDTVRIMYITSVIAVVVGSIGLFLIQK